MHAGFRQIASKKLRTRNDYCFIIILQRYCRRLREKQFGKRENDYVYALNTSCITRIMWLNIFVFLPPAEFARVPTAYGKHNFFRPHRVQLDRIIFNIISYIIFDVKKKKKGKKRRLFFDDLLPVRRDVQRKHCAPQPRVEGKRLFHCCHYIFTVCTVKAFFFSHPPSDPQIGIVTGD